MLSASHSERLQKEELALHEVLEALPHLRKRSGRLPVALTGGCPSWEERGGEGSVQLREETTVKGAAMPCQNRIFAKRPMQPVQLKANVRLSEHGEFAEIGQEKRLLQAEFAEKELHPEMGRTRTCGGLVEH